MTAPAAGDAMRQWDGLLAAQGREGRRLCDRDAGARAQRERDVIGAEDFISRGGGGALVRGGGHEHGKRKRRRLRRGRRRRRSAG
jgi:hypothetical protein